jgi:hypothetical protein
MGLNAQVGRSGVKVRGTSHLNASPFVLLSGAHQALVKPLPIGQLYRSGWPSLVLDVVLVGVWDWCCWQG